MKLLRFKKGSVLKPILIAVIILVVLGVGYLCYLFAGGLTLTAPNKITQKSQCVAQCRNNKTNNNCDIYCDSVNLVNSECVFRCKHDKPSENCNSYCEPENEFKEMKINCITSCKIESRSDNCLSWCTSGEEKETYGTEFYSQNGK